MWRVLCSPKQITKVPRMLPFSLVHRKFCSYQDDIETKERVLLGTFVEHPLDEALSFLEKLNLSVTFFGR